MIRDFWFKSSLFHILPGEEEETNPGCYGKELGNWLCIKLKQHGYNTVELIPEDWGWCVMCSRNSFHLWVGCSAAIENEESTAGHANIELSRITWHLFPQVEIPFYNIMAKLKSLSGMLDTKEELQKLISVVEKIITAEPEIKICDQPLT